MIIRFRFLSSKNLVDFELSPCEEAFLIILISDSPPKSTPEKSFDHIAVVAYSNIGF